MEDTIENATLSHYTDEVVALKKLLPVCRQGIVDLQELAMRFSLPGWKDLFVHLWSQQANNLTELEEKIWDLGGDTNAKSQEGAVVATADPEDEPADPLYLDKILLMRCINEQTHLLHMYLEARRNPMPFDVRMVLQRHQMQVREMLERLTSTYLAYPARPISSWIHAMSIESTYQQAS